ncbi:TOG array regulator of axonemal microtubules protein 2 isoform X1 [Grus americana]|uniref:TOG array regulator of axonemal microtubules protein 2 isoform X1 n=1 Tax=Grus americana TaxID=9117 RepID=UPI0024082716|nr:TOG array regulator of axonemal microtubules protein 2 isoform X1 [Grus americana]XP_054677429.1 TOG array regulator of axonemal microtubules protein 2 isoform X1 [Grus americana]XP_054677430.1 TOG array regulator of axonemal microtubules protein 2 isoform X1 [Grus americana]
MTTQDDFTAAKYHAPVAVYCGSVPKFKPRYTALRGGSIDSNLQFCGSSWTTEEEASFQSILTTQLKKQPSLWARHGAGKPPYPRTISPMEGRISKTSVHNLCTGDGDDLSHLSHRALSPDPQERRVSSAALETIPIKNKLKMRRMSEDLPASQRGLTDCSDPKEFTPKPVVSSSASQRLLVNSKPVPPIQNSLPSSETSRMSNGEQEHGENGTGCDDSDGSNEELMSEGKGYQASPLPCSGGDGKKSLRVDLIPPIPKSARPSHRAPGRAAVPLPSFQDLDFQEDLEMRPRSGSSSEEETLKHPDLHTLEPILPVLEHHIVGDVKSAEHLCEPVPPLTGLPLSQAKEMDHLMSPPVLSDDDLEDSNGRIHITLSKSAQKKIQQKRMKEMELLHRQREKEREKEKSLQLPTQTVDPEDADKESFGLPPLNGAGSSSCTTRNACREKSSSTALRKRVNRPSLPSIPVVKRGGSIPRKSSVNSLPAIALDFLEWGDEAESGNAREARPFPYPQQELLNALTWLSSDNWEQKAKGLFSVRRLAICHSEVLLSRLHDVSLAVTKEVNNLRTKVSRFAIGTLGELFRTMKKHMDHEVDMIAQVLLQKMGDTSEFIQKGASRALAIMVGSVTPARAMTALMASGIQHRNALVRKCAAEHLLTVIERIGAEKLLAGTRASTEVLVHTLVKLAQDCHQDTRCYGRKMLNTLMSHQKFVKYLKQTFPSRDLEDVMATIKQKGIEDYKCEPPPAKDHGKSRKSNLTMAQDNLPSGGGLKSGSDMLTLPRQTVRRMSLPTAEESEQLKELCKLLTAKDFQSRVEGVALLLDHCKSSCRFISTNIVPIFDIFALRLQDCNKKVSQQALEALALMIPMLRGALHPVLVSLVAAVTENLNSKHLGIYAAAVKVLEASIAHLDSTMLLQAFAHRLHSLSGQALLDITERISVLVASVYPRKPQAAKRYALPTLWFFLGNSVLPVRSGNVRAVVAKLAKTLYEVMGSKLMEHAANQPQHVAKNLRNILDLNVG